MRLPAATSPASIALATVIALAAYSSPALRRGSSHVGSTPPPRSHSQKPFFERAEASLKAVRPSKAGVPTREFLHASYSIITIFDALAGMGMVKNDMLGNCDKIWRHMTSPDTQTLEAMCDAEIDSFGGDVDKAWRVDGSVCNSLLWLKRALRLVEGIMKALLKTPAKTMKECCDAAYASSLKKYHNFVMKSAFSVAVNAAPSREEFLDKLAPSAGADEAIKTLAKLQPTFSKLLDTVETYLLSRKIEK